LLISFALNLVLQIPPLDTLIAGSFAAYIPFAIFIIAQHRRYLLEQETSITFRRREIRLLAYIAVFYLLIFLILLAPLNISPVSHSVSSFMAIITAIIVLYIAFRLVLVFPMIAVDYPGRILDYMKFSWAAMRHSVVAVFCAETVIYLAIAIVLVGFESIVRSAQTPDNTVTLASVLSAAAGTCLSFLIAACSVIIASYTFRKLVLSLAAPEDQVNP